MATLTLPSTIAVPPSLMAGKHANPTWNDQMEDPCDQVRIAARVLTKLEIFQSITELTPCDSWDDMLCLDGADGFAFTSIQGATLEDVSIGLKVESGTVSIDIDDLVNHICEELDVDLTESFENDEWIFMKDGTLVRS